MSMLCLSRMKMIFSEQRARSIMREAQERGGDGASEVGEHEAQRWPVAGGQRRSSRTERVAGLPESRGRRSMLLRTSNASPFLFFEPSALQCQTSALSRSWSRPRTPPRAGAIIQREYNWTDRSAPLHLGLRARC
eukprot:2818540-Prymnesium_polylepis.1